MPIALSSFIYVVVLYCIRHHKVFIYMGVTSSIALRFINHDLKHAQTIKSRIVY